METETAYKTRTLGYQWYKFVFYFDNTMPYKLEVLEKHSDPSKGIFDNNVFLGEINLLNDRYAQDINLELILQENTGDIINFLNYALQKFGKSPFKGEPIADQKVKFKYSVK